MINRKQIASVIEDNHIRVVFLDDDAGCSWTIFCCESVITIKLNAEGDYLLIRAGPLDQSGESQESRLQQCMRANEELRIGRFVGVEDIYFEIPFSVPNRATLTGAQLEHAITTTIAILATQTECQESDVGSVKLRKWWMSIQTIGCYLPLAVSSDDSPGDSTVARGEIIGG